MLLEGTSGNEADTDLTNHCVKSVGIRSFSGEYFPTFGLNAE